MDEKIKSTLACALDVHWQQGHWPAVVLLILKHNVTFISGAQSTPWTAKMH